MIRNIVFDMGMVLLEYDPVKVCWEYTDNPEDVEWMRRELFDSKEWSLLDEGTLTDAQALERVQKRLPNEHLRWLAKESLEHWHEYNIWAKPGMGELVKELKEKGCGIYLCSNCSVRLRVFEHEIPGIEYFDGTLVSAEEKLVSENHLDSEVDLNGDFCSGNCRKGVCVTVDGELYSVKPETTEEFFQKEILGRLNA